MVPLEERLECRQRLGWLCSDEDRKETPAEREGGGTPGSRGAKRRWEPIDGGVRELSYQGEHARLALALRGAQRRRRTSPRRRGACASARDEHAPLNERRGVADELEDGGRFLGGSFAASERLAQRLRGRREGWVGWVGGVGRWGRVGAEGDHGAGECGLPPRALQAHSSAWQRVRRVQTAPSRCTSHR